MNESKLLYKILLSLIGIICYRCERSLQVEDYQLRVGKNIRRDYKEQDLGKRKRKNLKRNLSSMDYDGYSSSISSQTSISEDRSMSISLDLVDDYKDLISERQNTNNSESRESINEIFRNLVYQQNQIEELKKTISDQSKRIQILESENKSFRFIN